MKANLKNKLRECFQKQIEKNCFLDKKNKKNQFSDYRIPYEIPRIIKNLLGENDTSNTIKYFMKEDEGFYADFERFKSLIPNGNLNPSQDYPLKNYFIKTKTFNELDRILVMYPRG